MSRTNRLASVHAAESLRSSRPSPSWYGRVPECERNTSAFRANAGITRPFLRELFGQVIGFELTDALQFLEVRQRHRPVRPTDQSTFPQFLNGPVDVNARKARGVGEMLLGQGKNRNYCSRQGRRRSDEMQSRRRGVIAKRAHLGLRRCRSIRGARSPRRSSRARMRSPGSATRRSDPSGPNE
jgi:hypothetical protein